MGRLFVASILTTIAAKPASAKTADVELAPIVPGAWAAWARNWDGETTGSSADPKSAQPQPASLRPAVNNL